MQLVVRAATDDDADLIAGLTRAAWAGKVAAASSGHRETTAKVREHLRSGGAFILLANQQAVGSVRWVPHELEQDVWELRRMGLLAEQRGANLSQHLLEAVIHQAFENGAAELRLAVRSDQLKLLDFYAAFGFSLAEELDYPSANPDEPAPLVMRRRLRH
jgi:predicted N-acetyltransferase YhbS